MGLFICCSSVADRADGREIWLCLQNSRNSELALRLLVASYHHSLSSTSPHHASRTKDIRPNQTLTFHLLFHLSTETNSQIEGETTKFQAHTISPFSLLRRRSTFLPFPSPKIPPPLQISQRLLPQPNLYARPHLPRPSLPSIPINLLFFCRFLQLRSSPPPQQCHVLLPIRKPHPLQPPSQPDLNLILTLNQR